MKTALVTGGTVRIGLAIAEWLRERGWRVITSSHREEAGADIVADLSDSMGAARLYAAALKLLGEPPFALINNAALFTGEPKTIHHVNFVAPQKLTIMMAGRENGRGAVVNILDACDRDSDYGRSKRELRDYTFKSAVMFAETLRVNAVAPGAVLAPVGVHELAGETLLGRPRPEDVARAVEFLVEAEATTGCVVPVDGGRSLL